MTITIEIISDYIDDHGDGVQSRNAYIHISDGVNTYGWRVTGIPVDTPDVQSHLDSRAEELWRGASREAQPADVMEDVSQRKIMRAMSAVNLDAHNVLLAALGLDPVTKSQWKADIKNKVQGS